MRTLVVIAVLGFAGCKEEDKQKAKDVAGATKDKIVEVAGTAKDKLGDVADKAKDGVGKVVDVAGDVMDGANERGKKAKAELDKVYKSKTDYAMSVDDIGSADAAAHAERLEKMPSIDVKGVKVGYEEDSSLSLRGTTYMKHFRASWKRGDKVVRVSFYTKETIDVKAFAELLGKIVPAVEAIL